MQEYTSKNTSQNQIPSVWKHINKEDENIKVILDYGCGKYNRFKELIESWDIAYYGYDPYNRTEQENEIALKCKPDLITCCNVLNVIDNDKTLKGILTHIASFGCSVIISVYEGNKSGKGNVSKKDCYQRNQKSEEYIPLIKEIFSNVRRKGNIIFAEPNQ